MSFWGSLFGGQNSTLSGAINNTGQLAGTASGLGTNNATAGSNWNQSILNGDPTKISQALAPEISAAQGQAQQAKNATAQFGTRSGGSAAATNATDAATRGSIINMVGGLQSGAASTLLSSGQNLLGTALSGYNQQAGLSQEQMQNWANSILGKGISSGIGAAESYGLGAGAGAIGGTGAAKGGTSALNLFLSQ